MPDQGAADLECWFPGTVDEGPVWLQGKGLECLKQPNAVFQPPATETPPNGGDTPETVGAPSPPPPEAAPTESAPPPQQTSDEPSADDYYRQVNPVPEDYLASALAAKGVSLEDIPDFLQRFTRNAPVPGQPDPTHAGEGTRLTILGGDPVELFSGLLTITYVDLEVSAPILPLRLVRSYQSGRPYFGPWGYGWDHNYNVYLRELANGAVAHWTGQMREVAYQPVGMDFEPQPGVHARLQRLPQPHAYLLTQVGGMTLRFEQPSGWTDSERIPLLEIRDRHGNSQTFIYDSGNRLVRVEDADGRALVFLYGSCGLLERLEDHTGQRHVQYFHHAEIQHLVRIVRPPTAAYPDGATTCYEYDFRAGHPAMRHNLLRVVNPDGMTFLQNEFAGPESGFAFNRVIRQLYGDFPYEYEYEELQTIPANPAFVGVHTRRAVVHPPDGSLHTYTFNYRGDLLDYRFRLNMDGSYRIVATQWEYDEQGNVTAEVSPDGAWTEFTYDATNVDPCARGSLRKTELFASSPLVTSRVVFQAEYDPLFQLPTKILDEANSLTILRYDFDAAPGPAATGRLETIELPQATLPDGTIQESTLIVETNERGQITAIVSAEGIRNENHYFETGLLRGFLKKTIRDTGALAHTVEYEYDSQGFLNRIITPPAIVTELGHDALGRLEELVFPAVNGVTTRIRTLFGGDDQALRVERPRGSYTDAAISGDAIVDEYVFNVLGRVDAAIIGANTAYPRLTRFCSDHRGHITEIVNAARIKQERSYDERGLLLCESLAVGTPDERVTRYFYDRAGRLVKIQEPGDRDTNMERDPWGRIKHVFLPSGSEEIHIWEKMDRLHEIQVEGDPGDGGQKRLLLRHRFDYDERGRRMRETRFAFNDDPDLAVELTTEHFYDRDGRLVQTKLPRGGLFQFQYDGLNRLSRSVDALGNSDEFVYDAAGNVWIVTRKELEPAGATRTFTWVYQHDERGRLRSLTIPSGAKTEFDYDDRDMLTERREPLGVTVRFQFGLLGEIQERLLDPAGLAIKLQYEHDRLGRLFRFTDPSGEVTNWQPDALGRPVLLRLADGSEWKHAYDPQGRWISSTTPAGSTVLFEYGTNGRLGRLSCAAGAGVEPVAAHDFTYDGLDRLVSVTVSGQAIHRQYDSLGRLVEESAQGKSVSIAYDDLAGTRDLTYPDGRQERTETDIANRATRLSLISAGQLGGAPGELLAECVYEGRARLHTITHGNGIETALTYDEQARLIQIDHTAGTQLVESCRYRYDARNRRRVAQWLGPPQVNRTHHFDVRDRLDEARWGFFLAPLGATDSQAGQDQEIAAAEAVALAASDWEQYSLDPADSRLQKKTQGGATTNYSYAAGHRVATAGAESFTHHADGLRIADKERLYDFDALGRVVRIRDAVNSAVLAALSYDGLGRVASGETDGHSFVRWFSADRWVHEEDNQGQLLRQQTPHPVWPLPLLDLSPSGSAFLHPDGALSAAGWTDASGKVIGRSRFTPFGEPSLFDANGSTLAATAAPAEPIFGAMVLMSAADIYASRVRLYDPRHGLFLARDPHLYGDSASPYLYAIHNPVDFIDPLGSDAATPQNFSPRTARSLSPLSEALRNRVGQFTEEDLWHSVGVWFKGNPQQPGRRLSELHLTQAVHDNPVAAGLLNVGGGAFGAGVGLALLAVSTGPFGLVAGAMALASGIVQAASGGVQLGSSADEAAEIEEGVTWMKAAGSSPGSLLGTVTAMLGGGTPEQVLQTAAIAAVMEGVPPAPNVSGLVNTARRVRTYNPAFRRLVLAEITATEGHPLAFLVDPVTGEFYRGSLYSMDPVWEAGHAVSFHSRAPELLMVEDVTFNQFSSNVGETQGAIFHKSGVMIGGLPVELRTAEMYESLGSLAPGTVSAAPRTLGWNPITRSFEAPR